MKTQNALTQQEKRSASVLAAIFASRMLGLFMLLPILRVLGTELEGATLPLLGLAMGIYGLAQAILQIPLGALSDKIGRKPVIYGGLIIFIIGSLVAALSDTIWGLVIGRALQGAGAIASTIMALAADVTRPEQRSKVMAMIGGSIGLAFALSLVIGPLISAQFGLHAIFFLIASLATIALLLSIFGLPKSHELTAIKPRWNFSKRWSKVSAKGRIFALAWAVFILHWALMSVFLIIPEKLISSGLELAHHSWLYLVVLVISIVLMIPLMIIGERKRLQLQMMQLGFFLMALSLLSLLLEWNNTFFWLAMLSVFFTGFNLLEAKLPATVSNFYGSHLRGLALGVFSSSQFLGAFMGGALTGYGLEYFTETQLLLLNSGLMASSIVILLVVGKTPKVERVTIKIQSSDLPNDLQNLVEASLEIDGVIEAIANQGQDKVYLRVDSTKIQRERLETLGEIVA